MFSSNWSLIFTLCPILLILVRKYREHYLWGFFKENKDLHGKIIIVTGSTAGIGLETMKELLKRNATVIMACRNAEKTKAVSESTRRSISTGKIITMELDLTSLASVRKFAKEVCEKFDKIDVLINNAGVVNPKLTTTEDGFEMNMGVNHLGHFLLTNLLLNKLRDSAPSRIVIVSSGLHESGQIDFSGLEDPNQENFRGRKAYSDSKLANVYFCRELAEKLKGTSVNVYSLCPGFCYTDIFRYSEIKWWWYIAGLPVVYLYMRGANQGCQTVLYCALSDKLKKESGKYYRNCKEWQSKHNFKDDIQKKLWEVSEKLVNSKL